ncbi:MAG TPA: DinB family protein [Candidatus Eisenbacteria bacterium]
MDWKQDLIAEFDQEFAGTRRMLERVPEEKFDWKPHPKSMSIGELAAHLVSIPAWAAYTVRQSSFDVAPVGGEAYRDEPLATRAAVLETFDRNAAEARSVLADLTEADMDAPWSLLGGGQLYFTRPKGKVLRDFIFSHNTHHRAQLGVFLRLNDIPVPGVYGPTADEQ